MNLTGVLRGSLGLALCVLAACSPPSDSPNPPEKPVESAPASDEQPPWEQLPLARRPLYELPDFHLVDQSGATVQRDTLIGKVWIAGCFSTAADTQGTWPLTRLGEIQSLARRWPDGSRVRLVSLDVTPAPETSDLLQASAELHQADPVLWRFLTGPRGDLAALIGDGLRLTVDNTVPPGEPLTDSRELVLVDAQGRVRGVYDVADESRFARLLEDLRAVLAEPAPGVDGPLHIGLPSDVFSPRWLDARRNEQLATAGSVPAFHGFTFTDRLGESGIRFVNRAVGDSTRHWKPHHYDHGNGLAVADVDGDGLEDLYFVSQVGGNELWRNLGGGRFENITAQAGVALADRVGVSASFADIDNDGDPDLFVTTTRHGNALFENDGRGRFRDITADAGLEYLGHSSSADFFDYDRDGLLDLFVTNVGKFTTDEIAYSGDPDRQEFPYYTGISGAFAGHLHPELSERSRLYHNDGSNRFHDASQEMLLLHQKWSGDATPCDLNDDGWIDLYVVNMQGNDEYYENIGGRRFERRSEAQFPRSPWGGMCATTFDFNNDGLLDLFVSNMHVDMWLKSPNSTELEERAKLPQGMIPESMLRSRSPGRNVLGNAFYQNEGGGRFTEVSDRLHAETYWPWGHSVADFNADGFQDLFLTAGMNLYYRYQVNSLLLNDHGRRFYDAEFLLGVEPRRDGRTATPWFELDASGADAGHKLAAGRSGRIIAWGALASRSSVAFDLDQDGDLDLVTNDFHSPPMVLVSDLSERQPQLRFLSVRLRGTRSNRDGLGARVRIKAGDQTLTQVHDGQSGYLSQSALPLYFGLGAAAVIDEISIHWPSGQEQVLAGPISPNQRLTIEEPQVTAP